MGYKINYKGSVAKDLKRLNPKDTLRIINKTERILTENPQAGSPLTGEFQGLFRLRVGDYRVIYAHDSEQIIILRIAHRKDVYRKK